MQKNNAKQAAVRASGLRGGELSATTENVLSEVGVYLYASRGPGQVSASLVYVVRSAVSLTIQVARRRQNVAGLHSTLEHWNYSTKSVFQWLVFGPMSNDIDMMYRHKPSIKSCNKEGIAQLTYC